MSRSDARERALEAARACFRRWGVDRTKMDDIAREAGMSRPALYQHFASKEAIIHEASRAEVLSYQEHFRTHLPLTGPAADLLLARLVGGIERSMADEFTRSLWAYRDLKVGVATDSNDLIEIQRNSWGPLLRYAEARGELRPGLDHDRVIRWLLFVQESILRQFQAFSSIDDVRAHLAEFVVPSLTTAPEPTVAANGAPDTEGSSR